MVAGSRSDRIYRLINRNKINDTTTWMHDAPGPHPGLGIRESVLSMLINAGRLENMTYTAIHSYAARIKQSCGMVWSYAMSAINKILCERNLTKDILINALRDFNTTVGKELKNTMAENVNKFFVNERGQK